ncbi:hypothetical protein NZD89_10855 [Alicyclobacillus fastidiosus]|uniref:Uncharacterized protein n=1 Tax=Alicyclobacillus fastidiosus TaxID=392011 RepID=A0ABY6ZPI3_9BACL|nr:hypothetical protein [Alicyclobacillus fastidiosus]WAH43835.1 hypothetical protein NZD89_10855 [Alicyclobacillus fastidiosus]
MELVEADFFAVAVLDDVVFEEVSLLAVLVVDFEEESSVLVVFVVAVFEGAALLLSACFVVVFVLAEPFDVAVFVVDVWFAVDVLFDVVPHPASPSEANKIIDAAKGFTFKVMLISPSFRRLYVFRTS